MTSAAVVSIEADLHHQVADRDHHDLVWQEVAADEECEDDHVARKAIARQDEASECAEDKHAG